MTNEYNERFALLTGENINLDANDDEQREDFQENKEVKKESDKEDSSKNHHSSEGSEKSKDKKSEEDDAKTKYKVLPYDPKKRKVMSCKLAFFFIIGMIYFYLVFFTGF